MLVSLRTKILGQISQWKYYLIYLLYPITVFDFKLFVKEFFFKVFNLELKKENFCIFSKFSPTGLLLKSEACKVAT